MPEFNPKVLAMKNQLEDISSMTNGSLEIIVKIKILNKK
jgi:hypothetical protein